MDDDHGFPALRFILEAFVAIALVGTFFVYGYPGDAIYTHPGMAIAGDHGNAGGPAQEPAEVAKLAPVH